jgi:FMN phosphatase YigB (HAD superfamily)
MTKAIIVDLDGTLSDSSHRQHYMEKKPKDWKSFYDGMVDDKPNDWCKWLVAHFRETHAIILVSGRPDDYKEKTEKWLSRYGIYYNVLHMRKAGDFRNDFIIKKEIYDAHIKPDYQVEFCVDDRKQVVDMLRAEGLVCLQCAEGNF